MAIHAINIREYARKNCSRRLNEFANIDDTAFEFLGMHCGIGKSGG